MWSSSLTTFVAGVDLQIEGPAGICSSVDKCVSQPPLRARSQMSPRAKGNLRVETPLDPLPAPGPISFVLRNGTESGGDGRKRTYEVGDAFLNEMRLSCCCGYAVATLMLMILDCDDCDALVQF
jgi:hypothetical protein